MGEAFDPYHAWLGIPPEEQPPDHYRLLGIPRFEKDRVRIENATLERMARLEAVGVSQHAQARLKLILEIRAARTCLLNENRRRAYNAALEQAEAEKPTSADADLDDLKLAPLEDQPVDPSPPPQAVSGKSTPLSEQPWRPGSRIPPPPASAPGWAARGSLVDEELPEHFQKLHEEALTHLAAIQRRRWWQFRGRADGRPIWNSPLTLAIGAAVLGVLLLGLLLIWLLM